MPPKNQKITSESILEERKILRRIEKSLRKQYKGENQMSSLHDKLKAFLPSYMMPGNVGQINKVSWPFWEVISFNFGVNPTWSNATRQVQSFNVTQEAGLLITGITQKTYGHDNSTDLAPLQVEIRDRQSSRQLNDRAIPLQMFGKRSRTSVLPTPILFLPNAYVDVIMTSWLTTSTMASVGTGKIDLVFSGYRIRVEDQEKVLSTVFG